MLHQGRQERNGAQWGGEEEQRMELSAPWECAVKGPRTPGDGEAQAHLRNVTTKFPFEFLTWKYPSISLSTPAVERVMLTHSCCELAWDLHRGRTARSQQRQEAITKELGL